MSRTPSELMVRHSSSHPELITAVVPARFFERGNAILAVDPARPVQLRPCLPNERPCLDWSDLADNALLIRRIGRRFVSAHYVTVAPDRMADTPENVEAAIADLAEHEPMKAFELRRAIARAAETQAKAATDPNHSGDWFAPTRSKRAARRAQRRSQNKRGEPG